MNKKLIVIGGTAAGLSAASKAKRVRPDLDVTVFEKSGYVSYGACGLPYFVGDMIKEPDDLVTLTVEQLKNKRNIETYIHHQVMKIDRDGKQVEVKNLENGSTFSASYDYLVIATGGRPVVPPLPGADLQGVHVLRTVEDGITLKAVAKDAKRVVVIGGGFIGLETAEQLCEIGLKVELIEALPRLLPFLSEEYSNIVRKTLEEQGIIVHTGVSVSSIAGDGNRARAVCTGNGMELEADLILMSVGSAPETTLARDCGLELGIRQAIVTNETQQTCDPSIWACGDCTQTVNLITNKPTYIPLGSTANKQGRVAGANIAGEQDAFKGVLGSMATKVFDLYIAATGLSADAAAGAGFDVVSSGIVKGDRASYYPGSTDNRLTLIFERKGGRLLGAQGLGGVSVAGRINALAVAITAGMTVNQLGELDLVYSPSVAPVYDPILIAANQAAKYVE